MNQEIKEFIENYNKCMDWHRDILKSLGFSINYVKDFIDDYLTTDKINEDSYDLEHAKVYAYEDGLLEMQAYSYKTYGTQYFWTRPDYTEQSYKEQKINILNERINKYVDEYTININELVSKRDEFLKIKEKIDEITI